MDTRVTIVQDEDIALMMEENDTTIFDILPKPIREAYAKVPDSIKAMDNGDLVREINLVVEEKSNNTHNRLIARQRDTQIKHSLWHEYDRAMEDKRKMKLRNIIHGVVTEPSFVLILKNKLRLEWIMRPPTNYWNQQRVLLDKSTIGLEEILDQPVVTKVCRCHYRCSCNSFKKIKDHIPCACEKGCICPPRVDVKLAGIKQKLHEMIEMRVKGAIIQRVRIDKQHLIAQVRATQDTTREANQETAKLIPTTASGINDELRKLRSEVKRLEGGKRQDLLDMVGGDELEQAKLTT